jgi:outer membrane protein assembly factor BamB
VHKQELEGTPGKCRPSHQHENSPERVGRLNSRRRPLLLALAAVLSLAACGTAEVRTARAAGCAVFAQEVSLTGQVNWQVLLGKGPEEELGPDADPLAVGGVAVFAQAGVVHGLRMAGGQALWTYTDGASVYEMWRWQGLVVVLTGPSGGGPAIPVAKWVGRLTGLDAATGAVRWTMPMSGIGPLTSAVATADGGVAVAEPIGRLLTVDMADGTVRWTRDINQDSRGLAATAGLVLYGSGARLTAYDDRTGAQRWSVASLDMDLPQMQLADGLLVVSSGFGGTPVTAYVPATGRVAWTFETPGPKAGATASWASVAAGPAGVAAAVANLPGPGRLYLIDLATGRARWHAAALVGAGPLLTAAGVIDIEGTAAKGPVAVVDRGAADGRIRWQDTLRQSAGNAGQGVEQLVQAGQLVLAQGNVARGQPVTLSAYRLDDGRLAWQITLPENLEVSPVLVPRQGLLIQPDGPFSGCGPIPV